MPAVTNRSMYGYIVYISGTGVILNWKAQWVIQLDYGDGYTNPHMIKLYRTGYTHKYECTWGTLTGSVDCVHIWILVEMLHGTMVLKDVITGGNWT